MIGKMQFIVTSTVLPSDGFLAHYGIEGMRWGLRRFQNADGTLTPEGRERYHRAIARSVEKHRMLNDRDNNSKSVISAIHYARRNRNVNRVAKEIESVDSSSRERARANKAAAKARELEEKIIGRYGAIDKAPRRQASTLAELYAECDNAEKLAEAFYKELSDKHHEELMRATLKDMKVDVLDDGLEFLDAYLGGDPRATYDVPTLKDKIRDRIINGRQNTSKTVEVPEAEPEYIDKVKTKDGDTRYFYDKDELKVYKDRKSKSNEKNPDHLIKDTGAKDRKSISESERELGMAYANMRNNSKTDEEKDLKVASWEKARDKDLWNLDFLEAVQNSKILHKHNKVELLTEYAKFLDDPNDYWKNGRKKLEEV